MYRLYGSNCYTVCCTEERLGQKDQNMGKQKPPANKLRRKNSPVAQLVRALH